MSGWAERGQSRGGETATLQEVSVPIPLGDGPKSEICEHSRDLRFLRTAADQRTAASCAESEDRNEAPEPSNWGLSHTSSPCPLPFSTKHKSAILNSSL